MMRGVHPLMMAGGKKIKTWTDFSEYETGQPPVGWETFGSAVTGTIIERASALSGKCLRINTSSIVVRFIWTELGVLSNNVEVIVRAIFDDPLGNVQGATFGPVVRAPDSNRFILGSVYFLRQSSTIQQTLTVHEVLSASDQEVNTLESTSNSNHGTDPATTHQYYALRVTDGILERAWWDSNSPRPEYTQVSSNLTVLDDGFIGVGVNNSTPKINIDFFSYGVDGRPAPLPEDVL